MGANALWLDQSKFKLVGHSQRRLLPTSSTSKRSLPLNHHHRYHRHTCRLKAAAYYCIHFLLSCLDNTLQIVTIFFVASACVPSLTWLVVVDFRGFRKQLPAVSKHRLSIHILSANTTSLIDKLTLMAQSYYQAQYHHPPSNSSHSSSHNHGGRSRKTPRVSATHNPNKQFRGVRSPRDFLPERPAYTVARAQFEAGRSFDLDDDLEFCPGLLTEDDVSVPDLQTTFPEACFLVSLSWTDNVFHSDALYPFVFDRWLFDIWLTSLVPSPAPNPTFTTSHA